MKQVPLSQGLFATVSDEDYEAVSSVRWHAIKCGTPRRPLFYAVRNVTIAKNKGTLLLMHRVITGVEKGLKVDHIDHDGLNNQRSNLRICSQADNMKNIRSGPNKTGFRGVYRSGACHFMSTIKVDGDVKYLGHFKTAEDAAHAYDAAAITHFGQFAHPNFPSRIPA